MAGFLERRRQTKQIERDIKFKQGLSKVRNYVQKCKDAQKRYWQLGKRSLTLGDRQQFENIAKAYLQTGEMISRWERFLVAMETISLQKDQVNATGEFAKSMSALSSSMMAGASPKDITNIQMEMERALAKAHTLDETLTAVMDVTNDSIFLSDGLSTDSLEQVEAVMKGEITDDESGALDERIATGLKTIEEQMRKETK